MDSLCMMDDNISKRCKYYHPENFLTCTYEEGKCNMDNKIRKPTYKLFKSKKEEKEFYRLLAKAFDPLIEALINFKKIVASIDWDEFNKETKKRKVLKNENLQK